MTVPQYDYAGRVALVTGAASGIGATVARRFAAAGASVLIADMAEEQGTALAADISGEGGKAHFVRTDVSQPEACQAMVDAALQQFGQLDIAFNNAGIMGRFATAAEYDASEWRRVVDINLNGVFHCMQAEIAAMRETGNDSVIVNTASVMGLMGGNQVAAYSTSKHGIIGLTRSAAIDHAREGIRINAICPGFVDTPMLNENLSPEARKAMVGRTPMKRLANADEIAEVALWLASAGAAYVCGAAIPVDGGYSVC